MLCLTPKAKNKINVRVFPIAFLFTASAYADIWLPPELSSEDSGAELSLLQAGGQLPGVYAVSIYLNGEPLGTKDVRFVSDTSGEVNGTIPEGAIKDSTKLVPWVTTKDMADFGVDIKKYPLLISQHEDALVVPGMVIQHAFTEFNFSRMRLNISIPQAELSERIRGEVPASQWDDGITAALLNYSVSGSDRSGRYGSSNAQTITLNSGLNMGAWRLRDGRVWQRQSRSYNSSSRWQHNDTYLQRAVPFLRSTLTVGDARTDSDIFDSLGFRGIRVATDEEMLPSVLQGFAPVVRGTAATSAEVTIRQNGSVVYQIQVPPGPFVIRDIRGVGTAGDLEVAVKEADGSVKIFTVPYSSIPVLVREGQKKYALTTGKLRSNSDQYDTPSFVQGSLKWGMPGDVTVYGGVQSSNRYQSISAGMGMNLARAGAVSADITHADSHLTDGSRHKGQSIRFLYSWLLGATDTTFNLVGYRYSTKGFHTLDETALKGMSGWLYNYDELDENGRPVKRPYTDYYNLNKTRKGRLDATISQRLGSIGSLYLTGSHENYWGGRGASRAWQTGFSSSFGALSYSVSGRYQKVDIYPDADKSVSLYFSVPLAYLFGSKQSSSMYATFNMNEDNHGKVNQQAGISGQALDSQLNWNISQGYSSYGKETGNASVGYRGGAGYGSLSYGYSRNYQSVGYGFSGGALLHRDGLTLGQSIGSSAVLISAPGASGAKVTSAPGVYLDSRGYAMSYGGSLYKKNSVSLDINSLPEDVDSDGSSKSVVPTRGAIVRADFNTRQGLRALITVKYKGKPLPFGTVVSAGSNTSIIGDGGQVYLSGLAPQGALDARWGTNPGEQCSAKYFVPDGIQMPVAHFEVTCR